MKTIYLTTLLLGVVTLTACGGGGSSSTPSSNNPTNNQNSTERRLAQIHKYKITATTTQSNCKGATGEMIINNSAISGTMKTGWGDVLSISGTYNSTNGAVDGGFAKNNNRLAQYSGEIKNNIGTGTWSDSLGCSGAWRGEGYKSNYVSSSEPKENNNNGSAGLKKLNAYDIQGYELGFDYERGTVASIDFACDGSFKLKLTLSGVTRTSITGDDIVIENHTLKLSSSQTLEDVGISLDNEDNIVEGVSKVTELDKYTVKSIKKVSECN